MESAQSPATPRQQASVLVVVLWIVFGLISLTLYFCSSMLYELRASDNRVADREAAMAIESARRYLCFMLTNMNETGVLPDPLAYLSHDVAVGNAKFYLIGRTNVDTINPTTITFGLTSEGSKLNLNSAWVGTNLALLPRMTIDLASNIMAWKSTNTSLGGAQSQTYMMQTPPYLCKNAPFETVDELRLVYNLNIDILYGEDANMNGILDPNENDGDVLPPSDNGDGHLDPGILEYLTIYTVEPSTNADGSTRIDVTTANANQLQQLFTSNQVPVPQIAAFRGGGGGNAAAPPLFSSPLNLFIQCSAGGLSPAQFQVIEPYLRTTSLKGLININTASATVLQCLPGMDTNTAVQLVAARAGILSNPQYQNTVCWVTQVLDPTVANQIGPYITARTFQYCADVAAVGHEGRGYRRVKFIIDTSSGIPTIVYRQDLTHLGWALGKSVREQLTSTKKTT